MSLNKAVGLVGIVLSLVTYTRGVDVPPALAYTPGTVPATPKVADIAALITDPTHVFTAVPVDLLSVMKAISAQLGTNPILAQRFYTGTFPDALASFSSCKYNRYNITDLSAAALCICESFTYNATGGLLDLNQNTTSPAFTGVSAAFPVFVQPGHCSPNLSGKGFTCTAKYAEASPFCGTAPAPKTSEGRQTSEMLAMFPLLVMVVGIMQSSYFF